MKFLKKTKSIILILKNRFFSFYLNCWSFHILHVSYSVTKFLKPFDISWCWAKSLTFWTKQHTYSRMSHYKFHSIHENEEIKANGLKVIKLHHGWAEYALCFKMALAFMIVWVFIAFCENWELLHCMKHFDTLIYTYFEINNLSTLWLYLWVK